MLSFRQTCERNKERIKSTQKQQTFGKICCKRIKTFCNIKLGLTKLKNTKNWRVTVNG